jgi:hypothetical protein
VNYKQINALQKFMFSRASNSRAFRATADIQFILQDQTNQAVILSPELNKRVFMDYSLPALLFENRVLALL